MSDLIKRLRHGVIEYHPHEQNGPGTHIDEAETEKLMDDAANEIERLEGELEEQKKILASDCPEN